MKYDEEIQALRDKVDALEQKIEAAAGGVETETVEDTKLSVRALEALSEEEIADLYGDGKITAAAFGAALACKRIKANLHERVQDLEEQVEELIEQGKIQRPPTDAEQATDETLGGETAGTENAKAPEGDEPEPGVIGEVHAQAHQASDGMKFTNLPPMKMHQRGLDAKKGMGAKDPLKMPGQDGGGDGEDPAQVVAEHGPANVVHVTHDHAAGKHHVHSEHKDGHATESDHESAEEAHDHGKALAMDGDGGEDQMSGLEGAQFE